MELGRLLQRARIVKSAMLLLVSRLSVKTVAGLHLVCICAVFTKLRQLWSSVSSLSNAQGCGIGVCHCSSGMESFTVVTSQSLHSSAAALAAIPSWMICCKSLWGISELLSGPSALSQPRAAFFARQQIPGSFFSFAQPCACVLPCAWYS